MKWYSVRIFDEHEDELLTLFRDIGVPRHLAATIIYLAFVNEASSKDIEIAAGLRQPEVSRALRYLVSHDWVFRRSGKYGATGRPRYIYSLSVPVEHVFEHFLEKKYAVYENQRHAAEMIGSIMCGIPAKSSVPEYTQKHRTVSVICESALSGENTHSDAPADMKPALPDITGRNILLTEDACAKAGPVRSSPEQAYNPEISHGQDIPEDGSSSES
ncbi:hypothetical protein J5839_01485 [Methanosarcinaceae archaeon]|nr:hypothetical protein [Methanosarcinaceae archaeon]MBQ3620863.1 hypothetical protein [Methanosarcinaceae archaeon]